MTGNAIGERYVTMSFGESHGRCVGVVIDGCPAGLPLAEEDIQRELDLRKPGKSLVETSRSEEDRVEILSGVFNGSTTGAPIGMLIWNKNKDSKPYESLLSTPRPGHADYTARVKYGGFADYRGGGRLSGRLTAGFVMSGAVAKKLLARALGVELLAFTKEIGGIRANALTLEEIRGLRYSNEVRCPDSIAAGAMKNRILEEKSRGDSVGGIVECYALNLPVGMGEPLFSSVESDLSRALWSIPAVKGVEFGSGFEASRKRGSEHNDPLAMDGEKVVTTTNNAGGVLGGITSGMPVVFRVAFKPPASIAKTQLTLDVSEGVQKEVMVTGKHDPCVVPRAVPVVECVAAMVFADLALRGGFIPPVLST
jgi:chorismate synthase